MKLYPPILEGTIPAFYFNNAKRRSQEPGDQWSEEKTVTAIIVPYEMNRGVSNADFYSMELKLKMVQDTSNKWQTIRAYEVDKENKLAYFDVSDLSVEITRFINIGQFYKAQIAYVRKITNENGEAEREIGYYSTVATIKYTAKPKVTIGNLYKDQTNRHLYSYIGYYSQSKKDYQIIENYLDSNIADDAVETNIEDLNTKESELDAFVEQAENLEVSGTEVQTFNLLRTASIDVLEDEATTIESYKNSSGGGGGGGRKAITVKKGGGYTRAHKIHSIKSRCNIKFKKIVSLRSAYEESIQEQEDALKQIEEKLKENTTATKEEKEKYKREQARIEAEKAQTEEKKVQISGIINNAAGVIDNIGKVIVDIGTKLVNGIVGYVGDFFNTTSDKNESSEEEIEDQTLSTDLQKELDNHKIYYIDYCDTDTDNILVPFSFSYGGDSAEKVYTYKFDLYDENLNLIDTTDWKYHDTSTDLEIDESQDFCRFDRDLDLNKPYYIEYTVRTINNLEVSSGKYKIAQEEGYGPSIDIKIKPQLDFENGRVNIILSGSSDENNFEKITTGKFKILRASEESNYNHWEQIADFALYGQRPSSFLHRDYTVKQGVHYIYAIQQYNKYEIFSSKVLSDKIYVDFEHAFLYDGERQLKIKYNPKVSSFKATKLESKLDTIGSKYPFILRNGNVDYKEFPISGLISYKVDEEFCFIKEDFLKQEVGTTNLIGENIADERNFKLEVLAWLTNGEPKVFKSPGEGNYIIRLLNVSMTPTDSLNRMLHTFNGTAYEIAEYNYDNLVKYGFINNKVIKNDQILWKTIKLSDWGKGFKDLPSETRANLFDKDNYGNALSIKFEGMTPEDRFYIDDGIERGVGLSKEFGVASYKNTVNGETVIEQTGYVITIGATGQYIININDIDVISDEEGEGKISKIVYLNAFDNPISADKVVTHQGTITYSYKGQPWNSFDNIKNIQTFYKPQEQFRGPYGATSNSNIFGLDIIKQITDVRTSIQSFSYMKFYCKDLQKVYLKNNKYYSDPNGVNPEGGILLNQWDAVYEVIDSETGEFIEYIDGYSKDKYDIYCTKISINGDLVDLSEIYEYYLDEFKTIEKELLIGNGVIAEIGYQEVVNKFSFEEDVDSSEDLEFFKKEISPKAEKIKKIYYDLEEADNPPNKSRYRKIYGNNSLESGFNTGNITIDKPNELISYQLNKNIAWQSDIENGELNTDNSLLKAYIDYLEVLEAKISEEKER